mmetsp:Transcript_127704/g.361434  ORF Transcript_127704/g.361434 Transcript_127704/m.361434 type:complete len:217 (+) Transcript_127704:1356-2006(+)
MRSWSRPRWRRWAVSTPCNARLRCTRCPCSLPPWHTRPGTRPRKRQRCGGCSGCPNRRPHPRRGKPSPHRRPPGPTVDAAPMRAAPGSGGTRSRERACWRQWAASTPHSAPWTCRTRCRCTSPRRRKSPGSSPARPLCRSSRSSHREHQLRLLRGMLDRGSPPPSPMAAGSSNPATSRAGSSARAPGARCAKSPSSSRVRPRSGRDLHDRRPWQSP